MISAIQQYWNHRIRDLEMTDEPVGTLGFFDDLDEYRFDKLRYLPELVDFGGFKGQTLLEVGCGIGTDLVRFARGGARVWGVDLADAAIRLARRNADLQGLEARLLVGDGEALPLPDGTFDLVFAHGVVQYTADGRRLVEECRRVLKPGGEAIFQVYNRVSWLNALSKLMHVPLEHEDAPVLRKYSATELRDLVGGFREVTLVFERFPVKSRLHKGWKGAIYNAAFVGTFNARPRRCHPT